MLRAVALTKHFPGKQVIANFSFAWSSPGIYLIAGPNGVGKSTLLAMLAGALAADAGEVFVGDADLRNSPLSARRRLSFCPADCPVFPFLTGQDWLGLLASVRGQLNRQVLDQLMDGFQLHTHLQTRFDQLSLGTARKILLLGSIAADTEILLLDEPSNGLDAGSLVALQQVLREQARQRLIILSCHEPAQRQGFDIIPERTLSLS
ncbi:ATP-binding cassette domain-containing protein [Methylomonas sp. ZR1]|uniref:ATP-binding cassette domain-containing protein n=1 Tax=unclassified Methylomonas TaxID=2608980 RepID=UPI001491A2DB|nr:ATP-binding cassette domain-containing protein [Methylomonas sp. ZR1]NOV29795.1 ATP-binding cassette domain-containing protein [Methylomonas sp. ZR1]